MRKKITPLMEPRRRVEAEQNAVIDAQFAVLDIMAEKGISKAELARRLGVSKSSVSQMFAAHANPTVRQLARVLAALDAVLEIKATDVSRVREIFPLTAVVAKESSRGVPLRLLQVERRPWQGQSFQAANENGWLYRQEAA